MSQAPNRTVAENLGAKIHDVFGNLAIDKRRLPASQLLRRGIPSFVGEWVLDNIVPGEGTLTSEEAATVQEWASRLIPGANDQNILKSRLLRGELVKILTPLQIDVVLNRTRQELIGKLSLIGISDAHVGEDLGKRYPDLLKQGMWGVTELISTKDGVAVANFKPMQATVDLELWKAARREFDLQEWISVLMLSMGYAPSAFTEAESLTMLCRLLPLVQKNMHLIELAPKGTGKSYIYENISPMVRLVSGGNVSPAVLFVNNATGVPGILARFSVAVLDEVQTLKFEKPDEIVGGLKGYLANARLTRGGLHEIASDCGLVLLANISLDEQQQPIADPLIRELPGFLQETAFLDRIRGLIPGWEIRKLSGSSFAAGVGLKSDFFGDVLMAMRNDLSADEMCNRRITLAGNRSYKRNEDYVRALASGFSKILFPHGEMTNTEFYKYCVKPALKLRQNVWNQLYSMDSEYRQFEHELHCEI